MKKLAFELSSIFRVWRKLMIQNCSNCSTSLDFDATFCSSCGSPTAKLINCPNCQQAITLDTKFCKYCAFNLTQLEIQIPQPATIQLNSTQDNPISLISPASAAFAVICFFLPWTQTSCGEQTIVSSGANLGGAYWFIPFMGIISILAYFICKYQKFLYFARPFIISSAVIALCFFLHPIYSLFGVKESQFRFGFFGSIVGFALTILGCFFMKRPVITNEQNKSAKIFN